LSVDSVTELEQLKAFLVWFCLWEKRSLARTIQLLDAATSRSGRDLLTDKYTRTELNHGFFTAEVTEDIKAMVLGVIGLVEDFTALPHIRERKWKVIQYAINICIPSIT
jgi:hypothetical protein